MMSKLFFIRFLQAAGQLKIKQELIIEECDCENKALEKFENSQQLLRDHYERIKADTPVLHERIDANLLRGFYKNENLQNHDISYICADVYAERYGCIVVICRDGICL